MLARVALFNLRLTAIAGDSFQRPPSINWPSFNRSLSVDAGQAPAPISGSVSATGTVGSASTTASAQGSFSVLAPQDENQPIEGDLSFDLIVSINNPDNIGNPAEGPEPGGVAQSQWDAFFFLNRPSVFTLSHTSTHTITNSRGVTSPLNVPGAGVVSILPPVNIRLKGNGTEAISIPLGPVSSVTSHIAIGDGVDLASSGSGIVHATSTFHWRVTPVLDKPDLVPTDLTFDLNKGTASFKYTIAGVDLPADTSVALYWARGPKLSDIIDINKPLSPLASIPRQKGDYGPIPFTFSNLQLDNIPYDATHLAVVVDPLKQIAELEEGDKNVLTKEIPLARGTKVSLEFRKKVIQIAQGLQTHPSYLMTVIAVETNGNFDPSEVENGSVGLLRFTGEAAVDSLNRLGNFNNGKKFLKTDGAKAKSVVRAMDAVTQLDVVRAFLEIKLPLALQKGGKASNLGDLYAAIFNLNLIGAIDSTTIAIKDDPKTGKFYTSDFDLNGDMRMTNGEVRTFLRKRLMIGFGAGLSSPLP